jgi:hypothetical protein
MPRFAKHRANNIIQIANRSENERAFRYKTRQKYRLNRAEV